ncbi:MAG: (2Fe-2S)-binding protein [Deltaproteobacteria bacterium]|nr:(2Fe-2S)-binding protein [Deltaproteobacteria bacterium]
MDKVKITIDGQEVEVAKGTNLIEAARAVGINIPHFCYHEGLSPDGNCRMCLVEVEKIPKPVIGCRTGATDGMVVRTNTGAVAKMRRSVMEFLLVNHPLDCPTCDQAGECKLQDYYMQYDRVPVRFKETKVHKNKMVDLGRGVMLDEERCVCCTRCVRFCREIAKKEELYVQQRGNHAMVSAFPGKPLTNHYAGCIADVCPVGAMTSKDFRYKKRVWFLSKTDSICPGCSRGCNITIEHEDKTVYRLKPRKNLDVNKYWMCDFGRYDYVFLNVNRRLKPARQESHSPVDCSYEDASGFLRASLSGLSFSEIAFIASAKESNENITAFADCAKDVFHADDVYYSKNDSLEPEADDILITADKNPNMAHVKKLGLKPVSAISAAVKVVLVQRDLCTADIKHLKDRGITIAALYATSHTIADHLSKTIFPIPTYAEQTGSFTNGDLRVQAFFKAFPPRGEARPVQEYLKDLHSLTVKLKRAG